MAVWLWAHVPVDFVKELCLNTHLLSQKESFLWQDSNTCPRTRLVCSFSCSRLKQLLQDQTLVKKWKDPKGKTKIQELIKANRRVKHQLAFTLIRIKLHANQHVFFTVWSPNRSPYKFITPQLFASWLYIFPHLFLPTCMLGKDMLVKSVCWSIGIALTGGYSGL